MRTGTDVSTYLLDVNVLVALAWPNHVHHGRVRRWWSGVDAWATTPLTEAALLRLSLNESVVGREVSAAEALELLRAMRRVPGHAWIADDSSLADPTIDPRSLVTSRHVTDLHLVNLAAHTGTVLATLDRGISPLLAEGDRHHVMLVPE